MVAAARVQPGAAGRGVEFQYPLTGRDGCSCNHEYGAPSVMEFQYPLTGRDGCSEARRKELAEKTRFQYPLTGRDGCSPAPIKTGETS